MPRPNKIMKDDRTMYYNTLFKMNLTSSLESRLH